MYGNTPPLDPTQQSQLGEDGHESIQYYRGAPHMYGGRRLRQEEHHVSAHDVVDLCDMGMKEEVKPNFRTPPGWWGHLVEDWYARTTYDM
jgi:hypothetical protein